MNNITHATTTRNSHLQLATEAVIAAYIQEISAPRAGSRPLATLAVRGGES
jgi:hypothetical protein